MGNSNHPDNKKVINFSTNQEKSENKNDLNNVTIEELENEVRDLGYDPEEYGKRALDLIAELKRRSF